MAQRRKKGSHYTPPAEQRHWYTRKQQAKDARDPTARTSSRKDPASGRRSERKQHASDAKGAPRGRARAEPSGGGKPPGQASSGRQSARPAADTSRTAGRRPARPGPVPLDAEIVAGRNAVVEALRAGVPASALYMARGLDPDGRVREAVRVAGDTGVSVLESSRTELDRLTGSGTHQGLALQVPAYAYAHPDDLVARARDAGERPLVVALDGVTDPRNLGAVVRSAAAFGCHGVVVAQRRAAGVTAAVWKASAGALARVPVARATNLTQTLRAYQRDGLFAAGLTATAERAVDETEFAAEPLVLVVGSEDSGLSRLAAEACDATVRIPMAGGAQSLNAGVATGIALYEVARLRRGDG